MSVSFWLISPLNAAAQIVEDYFQISYDSVSFNKNEINGSEVFYAAIRGCATCIKDFPLPVPVSEVSITSRIVAEHAVNGTSVTLNPSCTVTIKPFPSKAGDTTEVNQVVPLTFPAQAESGDYNIIGQLIEAKVKITIGWFNVTEYLPQHEPMGSVEYTAPEPTPTSAATAAPTPTPPDTETPASPEHGIAWWVWLIVAIAVATSAVNIIWLLRRRT